MILVWNHVLSVLGAIVKTRDVSLLPFLSEYHQSLAMKLLEWLFGLMSQENSQTDSQSLYQ